MSGNESVLLQTLQTSEDVQVRVEALRSLGKLATEIGQDRTSDVLLPQLKGLLEDDEEVLLVLAEELASLVNFLSEAKLDSYLFLLSALCKVEEEAVRRKATDNLLALSNHLQTDSFSATYIALVISLGQIPWFSSKMSAAALLPSAFQRADAEKKQTLIQLFLTLCKDKTPMARRAAATNMKYFVPHLSFECIMSDFVECFQAFSKDEQDSVRFLCIEVGASLARAFKTANKPELTNTIIAPVVLACAEDRAWRVRFMVASGFVTLASEIEKELVSELVHVFIKLLKDSEPEVRTAAAGKVSGVAKLLPLADSVTHLLPCITQLVKDPNQAVRAALAQDVMVLAPSFGKEGTNTHLLSIFLNLLKDDVPEVRLNVISKLDQVTPYVGLDQLSEHLIPAIVQLGEDKSWRVRLSVIGDIPPLAAQLSLDFFISSLGELCFSWLGDTVYSIRQAAISMLRKLTQFFGEPFSKVVVPRVRHAARRDGGDQVMADLPTPIAQLTANTNYLYRMTILFYAEICGPLMTQPFLRDNIFPLLFKMCSDPVANIRMASARAMEVLLETADAQSKTELQPYIMKLLEDKDPDVHEASVGAQKKL